jgi:hypothetical protein
MSWRPMLSGEGSRIALGPSGPSAPVFDCGAGRVGSRGERPETPLNILRGVMHQPLGWLSCRRSEDRCHTQGGTRLATETSIRIEWRRRSESWNHWAHYRRPGHYHFGDCDPATDLTRPGCEAIRLAEVPRVRVFLPVDVDRLNAAGAATGDKWDAPVQMLCMHVPPSRLAPRHPLKPRGPTKRLAVCRKRALAAQQHRLYDAGDTPVELRPGKAADAVSKISLARSQEAQ